MSFSLRGLIPALLLAAALPASAADAPPDVAVFVASLDLMAGKITAATNITPGKGSNFQPAFTPDGAAVVYTSGRTGSNNIYRHDLATGATTAVTATTENLYSPTPLADGSGFSAIRVITADPAYGIEMNEPSLWRFGWDGKPVAPVVTTKRIGYHAWVDPDLIAAFIVDDVPQRNAHRAVLIDRKTGQQTLLTDKPGRSLARTADARRAMFVEQSDANRWVIAAQGPSDAKPQALVETPPLLKGDGPANRPQYFVALPDGSVLMARGHLFLRWNGKVGSDFQSFADLPELNGAVRNIAASADGKRLAFSVTLNPPRP
ncbi:TolB family protein [Roseateles sp. DC23W]|uniref:TolB family protein n=1 Tax=Pelomonas dachongensis TaxID=3299029 RepID=A0ABW7EPH4_9BURK